MRFELRALTRGVVALILFDENTEPRVPRAVLLRSRLGTKTPITGFVAEQLTADVLAIGAPATDPEPIDELLPDVDAWKRMRDELVAAALSIPDFAPNEVDFEQLDRPIGEIGRIREILVSRRAELAARLYELDRDQVLRDLRPEFKRSRRTGLFTRTVGATKLIALPKDDSGRTFVGYFKFDKTPVSDIELENDGTRIEIVAKKPSRRAGDKSKDTARNTLPQLPYPLIRSVATRPRQLAAAIAALEAKYNGEPVTARFATTATLLGLRAAPYSVVHGLVRTAKRLLLEPTLLEEVEFLAPPWVNFQKLLTKVEADKFPRSASSDPE